MDHLKTAFIQADETGGVANAGAAHWAGGCVCLVQDQWPSGARFFCFNKIVILLSQILLNISWYFIVG